MDYGLHSNTAAAFWIRFALATLTTWRVSHLLASEDSPWQMLARLRRLFGSSAFGRLMDCFGCVSMWVAAPVSFFVFRHLPELFFCWLALSGTAFLLERLHPEPVVIERISEPAKEDSPWDAAVKQEQI
jgi:hypothetical protein